MTMISYIIRKSDKVEEWFVNNLKSHLKVDFMGDAAWFLGKRYDWYTDPNDGNVSCHISQQASGDRKTHQNPDPMKLKQ